MSIPESNKRLTALDYLRGLAAISIMVYHYSMWSFNLIFTADTILGRIGIYGVSIFYVLSGLTLFHIYGSMKTDLKGVTSFFLKRFFRIYPLLWVATIGTIVVFSPPYNEVKLFWNLTGIFGFIQWDAYIATGAWSIGNELVFYVFFPIFVYLSSKQRIIFYGISILIVGLGVYFAFVQLDPTLTFDDQWKKYVNPLNQLFLFLSGFWIGYVFSALKMKVGFLRVSLVLLLLAFVYIPVNGAQVNLVTDFERIIFSTVCIALCLIFYKADLILPGVIDRLFSHFGEISYSIYLLHPIVFWILANTLDLKGMDRFWFALPVTLIVSSLSYFIIEKPFMRLGASLARKSNP